MKEEKPVYEDITDFKKLKSFMENNLEDYNNEPGYIAMDLVLFRDAIEHGTIQQHLLVYCCYRLFTA